MNTKKIENKNLDEYSEYVLIIMIIIFFIFTVVIF